MRSAPARDGDNVPGVASARASALARDGVNTVVHRSGGGDAGFLALDVADRVGFTMRLAAEPNRLRTLRKRLAGFLSAHQVSETDSFDVVVAVSEAAANAIEHPVNPRENAIEVEVSIDNHTVEAAVRDTGWWRPATPGGSRGRGLALIGALVDVSVDRSAEGTAVRLRRRVRR